MTALARWTTAPRLYGAGDYRLTREEKCSLPQGLGELRLLRTGFQVAGERERDRDACGEERVN